MYLNHLTTLKNKLDKKGNKPIFFNFLNKPYKMKIPRTITNLALIKV